MKRLCWVAADTAALQFRDHGKHVRERPPDLSTWFKRDAKQILNTTLFSENADAKQWEFYLAQLDWAGKVATLRNAMKYCFRILILPALIWCAWPGPAAAGLAQAAYTTWPRLMTRQT